MVRVDQRRVDPVAVQPGIFFICLATTMLIGCGAKSPYGFSGSDQGPKGSVSHIQLDPEIQGQWWIDRLGLPRAWRFGTGQGVTIADCDSGFHVTERDLQENLELSERRDFSDRDNPQEITDGRFVSHGTAVAALIAGVRDGVGVNGIAFDSKLIPLQNFNYDRELDDVDKEEATARCVHHAASLSSVNIILIQNQTQRGSSETYARTREAVQVAIARGITVIAPAGNASRELTIEATHDTGSIIVGALLYDGRAASFSNFGTRVTVAAFGERIRTLRGPDGRVDAFGGTTAAAAQVAAVVALMLEVAPQLSPQDVRDILEATRVREPENTIVGGRLDAAAAVAYAASL